MTFTNRIRIYFILVAIIPILIISGFFYFQTKAISEKNVLNDINKKLEGFNLYYDNLLEQTEINIALFYSSPQTSKLLESIKKNKRIKTLLEPENYNLDFAEILDSNLIVINSSVRPGLIGQKIIDRKDFLKFKTSNHIEHIEKDKYRNHAALTFLKKLSQNKFLYCGVYLDNNILSDIENIIDVSPKIIIAPDKTDNLYNMKSRKIYPAENKYLVLLIGNSDANYFVTASFENKYFQTLFSELIIIGGLVAFVSIMLALLSGFYITGKAKREINNLIKASERIAAGDFDSVVMAYDEGEFSKLADSFTDMKMKLKKLQSELSTSEKIAAWETVGRKLAHELKNPLTPIAISTDDLRRSYQEKLPGFENTLMQTTKTIKIEVERLKNLLDQFVEFARMKAPQIKKTELKPFLNEIYVLFKSEFEQNRFKIIQNCNNEFYNFGPDSLKQIFINLIKNGFESETSSQVTITIADDIKGLYIKFEDNGTGFSKEKLKNSFEPYQTTKKEGTGLGLVICHRIIHDHGGSLVLENIKNGGGRVIVRLPEA